LKKYKSPGSDQIPADLIQAEAKILLSAIHKLINSVWDKEQLGAFSSLVDKALCYKPEGRGLDTQ
jgi:hypothetical protein